ncbi:MAG: DUF3488 and transglutaminase-like domain-containing protein [Nitrospirae bacterium]|nr:DUF3488 and transglutaminase-like domain-containing protein [Nitrospirota bacterium]
MIRNDSLIKIEDAVKVLTYVIVLAGFLSVVRHIEMSYALAFASLYLVSLHCEYRKRFLIPRWLLNIIAVGLILLTFHRAQTDDFVTAVVEALLVLLGIKLLENKRFRDYMQMYLIVIFLLAGSALLSIDMDFFLYFTALVFLATTATIFLAYYAEDGALALKVSTIMKLALGSSLISLIALPVTLFMFVILPRTPYPLLNFLNKQAQSSTGFTDTVRLGNVSDIQEDATVIFRAQTERIADRFLYWRGIVLDYFDGAAWQSRHRPEDERPSRIAGRQVHQTIYLEPYGNRYLFALDKPTRISLRRAAKNTDLTYSFLENVSRRTAYDSLSTLSEVIPEKDVDREVYLQLPGAHLGQTAELAKSLAAGKTEEEIVNAILAYLRAGDYRYSLHKLPVSGNPIEDFLFNHKYGNCEYFASAMAVMLRAAGIPSRLVGGYRGGFYNETGKYYLVPQRNAHVWVEAFLEKKGWVRLDPTPAGIENFVSPAKEALLFKVSLLLDAMNYYWNALVINYNFSKQITFFYRLKSGIGKRRLRIVGSEAAIKYFCALLGLAAAIFFLRRRVFRTIPPEEQVLADFFRAMEKLGYRKRPAEGLEEFVSGIEKGVTREKAFRFVREFEKYFYRDRRLGRGDMRKLKQLLSLRNSGERKSPTL